MVLKFGLRRFWGVCLSYFGHLVAMVSGEVCVGGSVWRGVFLHCSYISTVLLGLAPCAGGSVLGDCIAWTGAWSILGVNSHVTVAYSNDNHLTLNLPAHSEPTTEDTYLILPLPLYYTPDSSPQ